MKLVRNLQKKNRLEELRIKTPDEVLDWLVGTGHCLVELFTAAGASVTFLAPGIRFFPENFR